MMTEARRKGVNGVPFVVIDGKWAVSGGQTAEVYSQVRCLCVICQLFADIPQIFKKLANCENATPKPSPAAPPVTSVPLKA